VDTVGRLGIPGLGNHPVHPLSRSDGSQALFPRASIDWPAHAR
jgi:hypothetical protein